MFVYKYTDKSDGIVKYVGIVYGPSRSLSQRIEEHKKDDWYQGTEWEIRYLTEDITSRTDAEYFEAHYISLYGTDKYFNKSKAGWGVSKYLPDREDEWVLYDCNNRQVQSSEASDFLDEWLCSNPVDREKLMASTFGTGKRKNYRLSDAVNDALNERYNFAPKGDWSHGRLHIVGDSLQIIIPAINGSTNWYDIGTDGSVSWGRCLNTDNFVEYAKDYIKNLTEIVNKFEIMSTDLKKSTMYYT